MIKTFKNTLLSIVFFLVAGNGLWSVCSAQERIMVIADPHVFPQELIEQEADFEAYMSKQRKMVDLSEPIWNALMDTALAYHPSLVLIPGDLTRDGEPQGHAMVSQSLQALRAQGIPSLVIPGNHDLPDANWETLYFGSEDMYVKDSESHSYAIEPLPGVTVLGIDAAHGNAGIGSLSDETLGWILAQADSAKAKGNMIIAMCHWQLMDHFDMQGQLEAACQLKDAEVVRDCLMHHGVRVVLTGHFHVNSITTWSDTTGLTNDSIVEISTGSPITYPCPYRWLTVSEDRHDLQVETDYVTALDSIADLTGYSHEWMAEHTQNMIPSMALRAWQKVDNNWSLIERKMQSIGLGYLAPILKGMLPSTNEARIDLVQRHIGNAAVNMYLFHSEANENERPEVGQALADSVYLGVENMINEVFGVLADMISFFNGVAMQMVHEPVQSLVEDVTLWSSSLYSNQTDDLHPTLHVNASQQEAVENVRMGIEDDTIYDILGRPVTDPSQHGVYIQNGQKIIR